jgi:O-antigen/teichoic acid export membrane protein
MGSSALRKEVVSAGKHSLVYVIGQAISRAVGFLMIPLYTSYIAPAPYGALELIDIVMAACLVVMSMGVGDGLSRFYYAEKEEIQRKRVTSTVIISLALLSLPIVLMLVAAARWITIGILDDAEYTTCLQIALVGTWFGMLCDIGYTYLRMRYQARLFVLITTAQLVVSLALNIYFIVGLQLGILGILYSTLLTQALTGLVLTGLILRTTGLHVSTTILKRLTAFGLPLVPPQIALTLGFSSNRFFLRWFTSPDATVALGLVGVFSLGHKFGVIVNRFMNVPFNSFWAPRRLELLLGDEPHAKETVARMCTYATAVSVVFALLLAANITPVVALAVGEGYANCAVVVPFIALTYLALGLETHFKTGILVQGKTMWDTWVSIVSLAVILLWNYLFVPRFGLVGAATSNLAGFVVRLALIYYISQRLYPIPFEIGRLSILLVCAGGWYALSQLLAYPSALLTLCARTGFVLLFPLALFCVRFYRDGELEFFTQYWRKDPDEAEQSCIQA